MGIVGGVAAAILVLVIVAVVLVIFIRRKRVQEGGQKSMLMQIYISYVVFYGALNGIMMILSDTGLERNSVGCVSLLLSVVVFQGKLKV